MFKIGSGRHTWIAVRWPGLTEDGATIENEVELQVELQDRTQINQQVRVEREGGDTWPFAQAVTRNWKGVGDADGRPLPFSTDNFRQLFDAPGFAPKFGEAYMQAWSGSSGLREKNSAGSPGDGQQAAAASPTPPAA